MIFTAFAAAVALTSANLATAPLDGTHAGELARRFAQAVAPARTEQVQGWYAGRCYTVTSPDQVIGDIFVLETRQNQVNEGPIFDRPVTKMFIVRHADSANNPAMLDDMSPELTHEFETFANNAFASSEYSTTFEGDNALSSYYSSNRYDARVEGDYIYARISDRASNSDFAYCYFFKKVR